MGGTVSEGEEAEVIGYSGLLLERYRAAREKRRRQQHCQLPVKKVSAEALREGEISKRGDVGWEWEVQVRKG